MKTDSGSFRDLLGSVFTKNGQIYRTVLKPGVESYELARNSGVYEKLSTAGLLIAHEEIENSEFIIKDTEYCLRHPKIPMISYPWEWSFSMLKDAALIHLAIMEIEAWFIADFNLFKNIDSRLTHEYIQQQLSDSIRKTNTVRSLSAMI